MLDIENLEVNYQRLRALRGLSLKVEEGDLTCSHWLQRSGQNDPA